MGGVGSETSRAGAGVLVLLDTSILIDVLRGHRPAVEYLTLQDEVPACSEITRVEIIRGMRSSEQRLMERLFRELRWFPVDEEVARRAGEEGRKWRRSHTGIGTPDLIVAATALLAGADLSTTNVRHYPMFEGLRPPYKD